MDEQPNLREFLDEVSSFSEDTSPVPAKPCAKSLDAVGQVIEIASGLKAGDEVVAKAGAYVRDGDRIRPVKATAPSATSTLRCVR